MREMLDGLHPVVRFVNGATQCQRAMILEQECVVAAEIGAEGFRHLQRAGRAVGRQRHRSQAHHDFGQHAVRQRQAGHRMRRAVGRVCVEDGADLRTLVVDQQVHLNFRRGPDVALQEASLAIYADNHVRRQESLALPGGGGQDFGVGDPDADVAVVGGHPAPQPAAAPHFDDVLLHVVNVHASGPRLF